jgi:hypothetical protein
MPTEWHIASDDAFIWYFKTERLSQLRISHDRFFKSALSLVIKILSPARLLYDGVSLY